MNLIRTLLGTVLAFAAVSNASAKLDDEGLARECAKQAEVLLSKDISDEKGILLFKVAKALTPEADEVLLIGGFIERGRNPPMPSKFMASDKFQDELKGRGRFLLRNVFKKNGKVGKLALLYLHAADKFNPKDEDILQGITYLQSYGFTQSVEDLFEEEFDLDAVYKDPERPARSRGVKLDEDDERIAKESVRIGSKILEADANSTKGLSLVRLGLHLDPTDSRGLMTMKRLERGIKVKAYKTKVGENTLVKVMLKQAQRHFEKAKKDAFSAHMSLLYYRVCDLFLTDNKKVMLGIIKLEKLGKVDELDDLFNTDLNDLFGAKVAFEKSAGTNGSKGDRVSSGPNTGANGDARVVEVDPDTGTLASQIDGKKLRISGDTHRRREKLVDYYYYSDTKLETTSLKSKIENYVGHDVKDVTVESYIIGKFLTSPRYFIARKGVQKGVTIKKRGRIETTKIEACLGYNKGDKWGSKYTGWLVIIKDSEGKIINVSSKDSFLVKAAEKIQKYREASRVSYYSYYYYSDSSTESFNKNGDPVN